MSNVFDLIKKETERQIEGLEMIPSENYVSADVLKALGSILTDKYSEGYPGARYYAGNSVIDEIERYAQNLANQIFGTVHANVQPYSGSPANLAVDLAMANPGDTILGMALSSGGHLTHGASASFTSKLFNAVQYTVKEDGHINIEEIEKLSKVHKPKIIWVGGTAYPYIFDWEKLATIADSVGAYLVADISHIVGLIIGEQHPSPVNHVHVITTTTHKTLRGPRGAMILVTQKGIDKDPELSEKIDKAVFPGLQGGPHDNQVAALAMALEEAQTVEFKSYTQQIVKNCQALAEELGTETENHLILWDLKEYGFGMGYQAHIALEEAGIYVNKNLVPSGRTLHFTGVKGENTASGDPVSAYYPNGIRLGTPALTSRGMKEAEMKKVAGWIKRVLEEIKGFDLPEAQPERKEFIKEFRRKMKENENLKKIRATIREFTKDYPIPGINTKI